MNTEQLECGNEDTAHKDQLISCIECEHSIDRKGQNASFEKLWPEEVPLMLPIL